MQDRGVEGREKKDRRGREGRLGLSRRGNGGRDDKTVYWALTLRRQKPQN